MSNLKNFESEISDEEKFHEEAPDAETLFNVENSLRKLGMEISELKRSSCEG